MSTQTRSSTSSPCGCGGASHALPSPSGCGCGCGGHCGCGAGECQSGAAVRPHFFAGQLLTEEDLQALTEYTAAKSRLHNRHFFGAGVVCGFEVTCHPCGGGKVIVRPGHALDCCGNDIVLAAAQTLDVNALVRDLRLRLQDGIDCGDPCAGPDQDRHRQQYCLYVRYCESLTDPVSAFVTDEPCSPTGCMPTRVREGLRFELRCRTSEKPPGGLICQIVSCLGDPGQLAEAIADLTLVDHILQQSEEAIEIDRRNLPFDLEELKRSVSAVDAAAEEAIAELSAPNVRRVVGRVAALTRHLEKHNLLSEEQRRKQEVVAAVTKAKEALQKVATEVVEKFDFRDAAQIPLLEARFDRGVLERAGRAIKTASGTEIQMWFILDGSIELLEGELDEMLCTLLDRLHERLDGSPEAIVCRLRREVRELGIPCPPRPVPLEFARWFELATRLRDAWWHLLQDCICPAFLPPCPPCDDPGVLLACLEVESCEVVRICSLERTFVPTVVALRHWLPLHLLGEVLEALCCRDPWRFELAKILERLCPFKVDVGQLASAAAGLWQLIAERELPRRPVPRDRAEIAAPAHDPEELISTLESRLELGRTKSDLKNLQRELQKQVERNAGLEKRLKALEEARTS